MHVSQPTSSGAQCRLRAIVCVSEGESVCEHLCLTASSGAVRAAVAGGGGARAAGRPPPPTGRREESIDGLATPFTSTRSAALPLHTLAARAGLAPLST